MGNHRANHHHASNKLNPFYIEDPADDEEDETWDGDWQNDEDDWEDEGLLDRNRNYSYSRRRRRQGSSSDSSSSTCSPCRFRMCVAFSAVFLFFFIVLSLMSSSSDTPMEASKDTLFKESSDADTQSSKSNSIDPVDDGDDDDDSSESSEIKKTSAPSISPTKSMLLPTAFPTFVLKSTTKPTENPTIPVGKIPTTTNSPSQSVNTPEPSMKDSDTVAGDEKTATATEIPSPSPTTLATTAIPTVATRTPTEDVLQPTPSKIVLLGERHTGVEWWGQHLSACFPTVPVQTTWVRDAHWFQYGDLPQQDEDDSKAVLVYAVRNVYDWLPLMHRQPDYAPSHASLAWEDFLSKSWSWEGTAAIGTDNSSICQFGFTPEQVMPCEAQTKDESNPVYELSLDGSAYANILKLRAAKIAHVLDLPMAQGNSSSNRLYSPVLLASYHAHSGGAGLVGDTTPLITRIAQLVNVSTSTDCNIQALPPPSDDTELIVPAEVLATIQNQVDWNVEARLGYSLTDVPHRR